MSKVGSGRPFHSSIDGLMTKISIGRLIGTSGRFLGLKTIALYDFESRWASCRDYLLTARIYIFGRVAANVEGPVSPIVTSRGSKDTIFHIAYRISIDSFGNSMNSSSFWAIELER